MPGKNMLSQAYKTIYECLAFLEHPVLRTVLIIIIARVISIIIRYFEETRRNILI